MWRREKMKKGESRKRRRRVGVMVAEAAVGAIENGASLK
jgi:hypothetical protein